MADELIDIVDENNVLTGNATMKSLAHKEGLRHRTVHLWIYTTSGEILLQRRAADKKLFPDVRDISVAGHIGAGEAPIDGAIREINEEIGLDIISTSLEFFKIVSSQNSYDIYKDNMFHYVYFLLFSGNVSDLNLQVEEVADIKFFSIDELTRILKESPTSLSSRGTYRNDILEEIKKRIK